MKNMKTGVRQTKIQEITDSLMSSDGTDKTWSALKAIVLATSDDPFKAISEEWAVNWSFNF